MYIPICNVLIIRGIQSRQIFHVLQFCCMFKAAKEKLLYTIASKKLIRYKLGNVMNLQIKTKIYSLFC